MDATRTFSVQSNTAEALRNRINQANAQAQRRPQAERAQNGAQPVRRQNPDSAPRQNVPAKQNPTVQNPPAQRPGQRESIQPRPESAQARPVSAGTRPAPAESSGGQSRNLPAQTSKPAGQTNGNAVGQTPAVRQRMSRPAAESRVRAEKPVKSAPRPAPVKPSSYDTMAKTKPIKVQEQKKIEYAGSDEGGNTVVSVVKAIVYIVFVMIVSVFLALVIINVGNDMFAFVKSDELVEVTIPEYATLDEVTDVLYQNDIIRYPTIFKLFAVAEEDDRKFVAGNYTVHGMMNYEDLLDAFKEKPVVGIKKITIPEGYTTDEIIDLFVSEGIGTREGFIDVIQNYEFDYWFIDELNANGVSEDRIYRLDGYLFPDTYEFYLSSSEATVVNKLLKRFSQIFTREYREQSAAFGYTVDEVITLASVIEKEAASPSEFFIISSVFHNRLNNPWAFPKLESDATIVYQMQHERGERPQLTGADLEVDLAYNTYTNDGLPPGPIANPSASAMLAALSPVTTNYYFFYHHKGTIYPSETKEQHNAIVAEFKSYTEEQTTGDLNPSAAQ